MSALVKATLADIKTDSFIGVAGVPKPDGSIEAFSIHMFCPRSAAWYARQARPVGCAARQHHDQRLRRASVVKGKDGETMMVKYKDGEKKVIVTPADRDRRGSAGQTRTNSRPARRSSSWWRKSSRTARCWRRSCMSAAASRRRCKEERMLRRNWRCRGVACARWRRLGAAAADRAGQWHGGKLRRPCAGGEIRRSSAR